MEKDERRTGPDARPDRFLDSVNSYGDLPILLYLPVQDKDLGGVRKLFAFLTGVFGFGVASVWLLGNYVFVPGA